MTQEPKRTLHEFVYDEECQFREIKHRAWLLWDRLAQREPLNEAEQESYFTLCSDLLRLGNRMDELFDELFEIAKQDRKQNGPAVVHEGQQAEGADTA